jgi:hypothetical protein
MSAPARLFKSHSSASLHLSLCVLASSLQLLVAFNHPPAFHRAIEDLMQLVLDVPGT